LVDHGKKSDVDQVSWNDFEQACYKNDIDFLASALTKEKKAVLSNISSFLQIAVTCSYTELVSFLLQHSVFKRDLFYEDFLAQACQNKDLDIVLLLLKDSRTLLTESVALLKACQNGSLEIVKTLLSFKEFQRKVGQEHLNAACEGGFIDVVEYLLFSFPDFDGCSALLFACRSNHLGVVRAVLKNKKRFFYCYMTLFDCFQHVCFVEPNLDIFAFMIQDCQIHCFSVPTRFFCSNKNTDERFLQLFLKHSKSVDVDSLLISAIQYNLPKHVEILLQQPETDPSKNDQAPLSLACSLGQFSIVKLLLQDKRVYATFPVLEAAWESKQPEIIELLLKDPRSTLIQFDIAQAAMKSNCMERFFLQRLDISQDENKISNLLFASCSVKRSNVLEVLLLRDKKNENLLSFYHLENACLSGSVEVVRFLLGRIDPSQNNHRILKVLLHKEDAFRPDVVRALLADKRVDPSLDNQFALHAAFKQTAPKQIEALSLLAEDDRVLPTMSMVKKYCNATALVDPCLLRFLSSYSYLCCDLRPYFRSLSSLQISQVQKYEQAHQQRYDLLLQLCFQGITDLVTIVLNYIPRLNL
jgi:ankyrin repeat protein